jgi:hypothetical protein
LLVIPITKFIFYFLNKGEEDEETLVLFALTCNIHSPSPTHVCMAYCSLDICYLKF